MYNTSTITTYGGSPTYLTGSQNFVSRASTATYFNNSGTLSTAAANATRTNYTYNGSSWVNAGTLIEAAATNLLTYSNTFSSGSWLKPGVSNVQNVTGLDGGTTAWTIT